MACLDDLKAVKTRNIMEIYVHDFVKLQFAVLFVVRVCRHMEKHIF